MSTKKIALFSLIIALIAVCVQFAQAQDQVVIGGVEMAILSEQNMKMKARIDTGAGLTSIDAKVLEIRKAKDKDGADEVVFEVHDIKGTAKTIKAKIVGWINIKAKGAAGSIRRPIVMMRICLGGKKIYARVNLADRTKFLYPLLIGRNTLKAGDFLIDPSKTFMRHPECDSEKS